MEGIVYRLFTMEDVSALVGMWKESRSGWPPGFFGASEVTASSVEQEERSSGAIFSVIALEGERIVGYCRTSPYGGEPEASYVSLINVVPDRHGAGIGRMLLIDAIERSSRAGMNRIDLHTWPANMKAVPLYKKTGFFWVPDTRVYMQNYIPGLLRMEGFREFLGDDHWYSVMRRELEVEPDDQRTPSGRQVFNCLFVNDNGEFTAEFDRRGRCLSGVAYPGFSAALKASPGERYLAGKPVELALEGTVPTVAEESVNAAESLPWKISGERGITVTPSPVRVPRGSGEPGDRVTVDCGPVKLGIGMDPVEEVCLYRSEFRFLPVGAGTVTLGLKRSGDAATARIAWSVNDGEERTATVPLRNCFYQSVTLPLPELPQGVHRMSVRVGASGYPETVALVVGIPAGEPVTVDTRAKGIIVAGGTVLTVNRMGGYSRLYRRGHGGESVEAGRFMICPGPPSWNSDLPLQRYRLAFGAGEITGETSWPSRPGLIYRFRASLAGNGVLSLQGSVENGSDNDQQVWFRARNGYGEALEPKTDLIPLKTGLIVAKRVYNQVPDWDEDLPRKVSGLAAPWLGVSGGGMSVMCHFPDWTELEYDLPGTADAMVAPGETMVSPELLVLAVTGGHRDLLETAAALGWRVDRSGETTGFPVDDLLPVMAEGSQATLKNPFSGKRDAEIRCNGNSIAGGTVRSGEGVTGVLEGKGASRIDLVMAGRSTMKHVVLVDGSAEPVRSRDPEGLLLLENGRLRALMDPAACGQVFSVKVDGMEFLKASRPEPSEFVWEKPWFGGIHPRYMGGSHNTPFPLEKHQPLVEECVRVKRGLRESGWRMRWNIDHRELGTVALTWTVWLMPELPVIATELLCVAPGGTYLPGELDVRGFSAIEGGTVTCDSFPGLQQGRDHAGAWTPAGNWARVARGDSFLETHRNGGGMLMVEDYGESGCDMAHYAVHDRESRLFTRWIFGTPAADDETSGVLRSHL